MANNEKIEKARAMALSYMEDCKYDQAEAQYLQILQNIGETENELIGTLHIDLALNAEADGRSEDATEFYKKALEYLESQQGAVVLQKAYVNLSLARLYWTQERTKALNYCVTASSLFISCSDIPASGPVLAKVLYTMINFDPDHKNISILTTWHETWRLLYTIPYQELFIVPYQGVFVNMYIKLFLCRYLQLLIELNQEYEFVLNQIDDWSAGAFGGQFDREFWKGLEQKYS